MSGTLSEVLETTVSSFGLELVDFELSNRGRMVRLFIDRPGSRPDDPLSGITVEDCERVTRHLQRVLPVEGIEYDRLEVSSPGLDRVVKRPADFVKFAGFDLDVRLRVPRDGRRRFAGRIVGANESSVALDFDGMVHTFVLADIERARLVPKLEIGAKSAGAPSAKKSPAATPRAKKTNGGEKPDGAGRGTSSRRRA